MDFWEKQRKSRCCSIKGVIISNLGWTIIDTFISILIFSIVVLAIFLTINHVSGISIKSTSTLFSDIRFMGAEVILKRVLSSSGNGLPEITSTAISENIHPIILTGYNETPQDFSITGNSVKFIDGNNDSKNGFGYIVVRTCTDIMSLDTPRWGTIESDGKDFRVLTTSEFYPKSDDIISITNITDRTLIQSCILKKDINSNTSALSFSSYGLPNLHVGKYIVCSIKSGFTGTATKITPYNRIDIILTSLGNPSYCAKGTYSLSMIHYDPVDGSETVIPLLGCVAGFKVKFLIKKGNTLSWTDDISSISPINADKSVKAVAIFLVIQRSKKTTLNQNESCVLQPFVYDGAGNKVFAKIDLLNRVSDCKRYKWRESAFIIPIYGS